MKKWLLSFIAATLCCGCTAQQKSNVLTVEDYSKTIAAVTAKAQSAASLEQEFLNPRPEHQATIIWQWMDGLVNKEGITADLEAFKEAGLAGVQNFQIGGPRQIRVSDTTAAIGSAKWKSLMRWAMDECERLGLTFGTHNCPGWSSSASPSVEPQYSMLKLVYSETALPAGKSTKSIRLEQPAVDSAWNYYEDVIVLAIPNDTVISKTDVIDLSQHFNRHTATLDIPESLDRGMVVLRIGQTTIGKTNQAQSPASGRGLECDKLSREAVLRFWQGYPKMIIDLAGHHVGKTFTNFEIDSYEAGGQTWTGRLPEEFKTRRGYSIMPFLPYMIERCKVIESKDETARFKKDWQQVIQSLTAENYYGYMNRLANEAGLQLLIEPYGTGGQRPFHIIDFYKITDAAKNAIVATEFWTYPNWGWKDMAKHEKAMRNLQRRILYAEAFTCWPLKAWQDDPQSLKAVCDRAFCTGVNRMMLHAGAANPWTGRLPGMSFGIWGTQFVPGQTWWRAGGAKELFGYMARCQSLLQRGLPAKQQMKPLAHFKTYRRTDGDTDIYFICNPTASHTTDILDIAVNGRSAEIWNPYTMEMHSCPAKADMAIEIEPYGSRFVILRPGTSSKLAPEERTLTGTIPVGGTWSVSFPECASTTMDSLTCWTSSGNNDIKYFSGTATYAIDINLKKKQLRDKNARFILSLGEVKNMAHVSVNGIDCGLLWKAPFTCDITSALRKGCNRIAIEVTNLWPNRMIGDEQEPDDIEWGDPLTYEYAPGSPTVGYYMTKLPDWLRDGTPRLSKGRKSVYAFKFFTKDSPLLPSGLFGPVVIRVEKHKNSTLVRALPSSVSQSQASLAL